MKTSELIGPTLDWAVAKCEGYTPINHSRLATVMVERVNARGAWVPMQVSALRFSTDWAQGGPIIERECIALKALAAEPVYWRARTFGTSIGPTPLIAAMRCYVASKLGDEVDIPKELM